MAEKLQKLKGKSIPVDVIEAILTRLPVKSLIRFKLVSKSCKAIISDPYFSKINYDHLSKSHNLFLCTMGRELEQFCLTRLEGASILQTEAELGAPFGAAVPLCSCNGIVLLLRMNKRWHEFVLWNPSIRRHTVIRIPVKLDMRHSIMNAGLYHDSGTDDYKIAVNFEKPTKVYSYSCKTRTWTEEELTIPSPPSVGGVVDGCLYLPKAADNGGEILCYDFREGKTEELKLPDDFRGAKTELTTLWSKTAAQMRLTTKTAEQMRLTTLWGGRLCLHPLDTEHRVWVRENDGWRDVSDMLKTGVHFCRSVVYVKIGFDHRVIDYRCSSKFVMYNDCEKRFEELEISGFHKGLLCSESLFFPFEGM